MLRNRKQGHVIKKQVLEVEMEDVPDAFAFRNQLSSLYHDRIFPKLSDIFDSVCSPGQGIVLDTLEIDLGRIEPGNWEDAFVEKTLRELKARLLEADKKKLAEDGEPFIETFFYFLRYGRLPWNSQIKTVEELEQVVLMDENFIKELKRSKGIKNVLERLVYRFSEKFNEEIIQVLSDKQNGIGDEIFSILKEPGSPVVRRNFLQWVIQSLLQEKTAEMREILNEVKDMSSVKRIDFFKEKIISTQSKETPDKAKEEDAIYIQNAGMIVLHPFLPEFFERLSMLVDNKWKDEYQGHRAVQILELFLNGKENNPPEFDLVLNKILCGMDTDEVLEPWTENTDTIWPACNELLEEVIRHWKILKGTSVEALQETFLRRAGKLERVTGGWLLQVEQKGVDVLLNSLPWGLGVIRLPWMKETIYVEWA